MKNKLFNFSGKDKKDKVDLFLFIFILFFLISNCNQSIDKTNQIQIITEVNEGNIDKNLNIELVKMETQQTENITFFSRPISLITILQYYEHTSGRTNKPNLISNCDTTKKLYGSYSILDGKSELSPPIIAHIFVSFEKTPWFAFDTNQRILALVVRDKLFKFNPFSFAVGDSIEKIDTSLIKQTIIDDIHYYGDEYCTIAVKTQNNFILEYLIWVCNSSIGDIQKKHSIVTRYFNP